ncbi:hypothetical protein GCM10023149_44100 [Mucilaginibacter gynuensis]|uniref:Uncharacterized protein n=1 Tax=Mucilaginibacter gynuensis TaxID=1302236 RepID=A0ABP8H8G2_9SPHI
MFNDKANSKLDILGTTISRNKAPASTYIYNKKYYIHVFKTKTLERELLSKIVKYQRAYSVDNMVFASMPSYKYDLRSGFNDDALVTLITYNSDQQIMLIKQSEKIISLFSCFKNFSISYNSSSYELYGETDNGNCKPMCLSFVKAKDNVYIILMAVANGKEFLPEESLDDLLK